MEPLTQRLERLERQVALWREVGGLVLLLVGARQAGEPKTVEAERIVLKDRDGRIRMELGIGSSNGVTMDLIDQNRNRPFNLGVRADGRPTIGLSSPADG